MVQYKSSVWSGTSERSCCWYTYKSSGKWGDGIGWKLPTAAWARRPQIWFTPKLTLVKIRSWESWSVVFISPSLEIHTGFRVKENSPSGVQQKAMANRNFTDNTNPFPRQVEQPQREKTTRPSSTYHSCTGRLFARKEFLLQSVGKKKQPVWLQNTGHESIFRVS